MTKETPKEIFLKDYKGPNYAFEKVAIIELSWHLILYVHPF